MGKAYLPILMSVALLALSGCELLRILGLPVGTQVPFNPKAEAAGVTIKRNLQFADIPVPMAFELRRERFFSYECATFRIGRFFYEGAWPYRRTKAFYDEQMVAHEWGLLSDREADIMAEQFWAKGSDRCRIIYDNSGRTISVRIDVYPVGSPPAAIEIR